jgi:hypothetical protein
MRRPTRLVLIFSAVRASARPRHGVLPEHSTCYKIGSMRRKRFCGARTRRDRPCQCKAIETKRGVWRCRLHGGLSTGPKTAEGRVQQPEHHYAHARARPRHGVLPEHPTCYFSSMRRKRFCGARTRRGTPCQCKAIRTKRGAWRCRLHGGLSTGPKTPEGRARIAAAVRQRGSSYTPDLADRICSRIANVESLRSICREPDMPPAARS